MAIIHIALLLELIALWLERMVPATRAFLPLGGDHFTQLAALVILAVILALGWAMVRTAVGEVRRYARTWRANRQTRSQAADDKAKQPVLALSPPVSGATQRAPSGTRGD